MSKNKNSGLGRGLDSLIPTDYYNEDFDANSAKSLEDMLKEKTTDDTTNQVEDIEESKVEDESVEDAQEEIQETSKDSKDEEVEEEIEEEEEQEDEEEIVQDPLVKKNVQEVMEIVHKNPRITLWSVHSSAVFRYLRKTQPEFSISNEASSLIDEAVSQKYPEIWKLFEDEI